MRNFPLDPARVGTFQVVEIAAKSDGDGGQKTNRDGIPQWTVQVLNKPAPTAEGFQPKAGLEEVTITASQEPKASPLSVVTFAGLVARPWDMNGRSGVALSADAVQPARQGGEG